MTQDSDTASYQGTRGNMFDSMHLCVASGPCLTCIAIPLVCVFQKSAKYPLMDARCYFQRRLDRHPAVHQEKPQPSFGRKLTEITNFSLISHIFTRLSESYGLLTQFESCAFQFASICVHTLSWSHIWTCLKAGHFILH